MSANDEWPVLGPVLETCDGCGACCLEQGAPPDYVALRLNPQFVDDPSFADDAARLSELPDEAQRLLEEYLLARETPEFATSGACVWYDAATFRCRFYEYRPSTCRVFERNSPGCHIYRRRHGVGDAPGDEKTVRD
jgi:Fe-S-cluster containining protein